MRKISIILCLCFSIFKIQAQNPEDKLGTWYMYNGSHKVSEKWSIKTMAHFRYYEFASNFQQEIYRLGANYTFHKKLNVTLGYSYLTTDVVFGKPNSTIFENRIYEDINYTNFLSKLKLRHRFRFEHRFLKTNSINDTSQWFRYDLNLNYPITDKWSVYAFNEIFLNLDQSKRFVQNWAGAGFLYKLNENIKLNLGYFYQKLPNAGFNRILVGVVLNTDFNEN